MNVVRILPALLALALAASAQTTTKIEESIHRANRPADSTAAHAARLRSVVRTAPKQSLARLTARESERVVRKGLVSVGVDREVPAEVFQQGSWSQTADGSRAWRLTLTSPDAAGLRVHFTNFHVGDAKVWLFAGDESTAVGPYTGDGVHSDGDFWTDLVQGDSVTIVYEDGASDDVPFKVAALSHRFAVRAATAADDTPQASAATCAVDVNCHPEYSDAASAVALMIFESDGSSYECTGSLINSAAQPARPFFLTANHCISTQSEARTLITFFNYQTSTCNGTRPTLSNAARVTGANFIDGGAMALGDFTLLELSAFPNIDVKVLGWTGDEIGASEQVTGISHPLGDFKRIALGQRTRDVTIRFSDGERMPASKGYQVAWFEGVTQGGSSGSPLLADVDGKRYVVGTLTAGPDVNENNSAQVCATRNLIASYGRFSAALPTLNQYLGDATGGTPVSTQSTFTTSPITDRRVTLTWSAPAGKRVQIRVNSPNGQAMTGIEPSAGSATTGTWVTPGMVFYLQDASDGNSLGSAKTLATVTVAGSAVKSGTIIATPNPISPGSTTRLNWTTTGVANVQIRINSATGQLMTGIEGPSGTAVTGTWVADGMVFYLQDASDGNSAGASKTLSTVRVTVR